MLLYYKHIIRISLMKEHKEALNQNALKYPAKVGVFVPSLIISAISFISPTLMLFFFMVSTVFVLFFIFPAVLSQYSNTSVIVSTLKL